MTENEKNKNLADKVAYIFRKYTRYEVSKAFGFANQAGLTGWDNPLNPKIRPVHLLGLQEYFQIPVRIFDDVVVYNELEIDREIQKYKNETEEQEREKRIFKSLKKHQLIPKDLNSKEVLTNESIDKIVKEYKEKLFVNREDDINKLFPQDQRIWNNLKGDFYAYMYGSHVFNGNREIKCIKTTFYDDFQVIDQHKNKGVVLLGDYQGIIIKKTPNAGYFSIIIFHTKQVTFGTFRFHIVSI